MTDELNFVQKARREKLDALVAAGVAPFGYGYERSHQAADAVASLAEGVEEGPSVRVAGRLVAWRGHGKTAFAHLADASGRIQLYFRKDELGDDTFAQLALYDIGDVVGVEGPLMRTRTGEVTVRVTAVEMLAKLLTERLHTELTTQGARGLTAIEMEVEENFGQSAVYRVALP